MTYPLEILSQCDIVDFNIDYCGNNSVIDLTAVEPNSNGIYSYSENGNPINDPMVFAVIGNTEVEGLFVETGTNCMAQFTISISEQPIPSTNFLNVPILSCWETEVQILIEIIPTGNYEYVWSGPGVIDPFVQNPRVYQPGVYFVEALDLNTNCYSQIDSIEVIDIAEIPNVFVALIQNCNGTATLKAINVDSTKSYVHNWSGSNFLSSTDSSEVLINQTGYYTLTSSDYSNGCQLWQSINVDTIKNEFNSIHSSISTSGIRVYPNPFTQSIQIDTDFVISDIKLFDIRGEEVGIYNNDNNKVNLKNLPLGVYFVGVEHREKFFWRKIVKN